MRTHAEDPAREGAPAPAAQPQAAAPPLIQLQRVVGNAQVQRMLARRAPEAPAAGPAGAAAEKAAGVRAEMDATFGSGAEVLRIFRSAAPPAEFMALQAALDMKAVLDFLSPWEAVQLGAMGPVAEGAEDALARRRAAFIVEAVRQYGPGPGEVFTIYVFRTAHTDDLRRLLAVLAAEKRLAATVLRMPVAREVLAGAGIKPGEYGDREGGAADFARGLFEAIADAAPSPAARDAAYTTYQARKQALPPAYQEAADAAEQGAMLEHFSPGNVALGALDQVTLGFSSAVYGVVGGTVRGVADLAAGDVESAGHNLSGPLLLLLGFLGVRVWERATAGAPRDLKGAPGEGQFVMLGHTGPASRAAARELARAEAVLGAAMTPHARAAAGVLFARLGEDGVKKVAAWVRADSAAARLVYRHGVDGMEALLKAEGDAAKAATLAPPARVAGALPPPAPRHGPFIHQLNKGGLEDIRSNQRLLSTDGRSNWSGEGVRAFPGTLPEQNAGGRTHIEFMTYEAPSWEKHAFGKNMARWPIAEGEYLRIRLLRIHHGDGRVETF